MPFALWIHDLPGERRVAFRALKGGAFMGVLYWGVLVYWILVALIWFSKLAVLAYLGALFMLVGTMALFGWALHRVHHGAGVPIWLALPLVWTAAEWFRAHWGDLAFPWLGLGTSLTGYPELVGMAEVIGARGVTFWIALVGGLLTRTVLEWRRGGAGLGGRSWVRTGVVTAVVVVAPMAWGVWRAATLETRPAARVAVVQPNIPEHIKLDGARAMDSTWSSLETLMPRVEPGSVDLVVWPEVTFPALPEERPALVDRIARVSAEVGAPIVVGAYRREFIGSDPDDWVLFNSAFVVDAEGLRPYAYDKRYLVPVVERVPFLNPEWFGDLRYFGALGAGRDWPLARVGSERGDGEAGSSTSGGAGGAGPGDEAGAGADAGTGAGAGGDAVAGGDAGAGAGGGPGIVGASGSADAAAGGGAGAGPGPGVGAGARSAFGVLICYESSFPSGSRRFRLEGADFLVNITNDAWYGREPWYSRTTALWQHPAHMVMRAIEHRVGVARSANTGISLFVDPVGRKTEETNLFEAAVRVATVETTDVTTLYTRLGDVTGNGAALATVLLLLVAWRRGREEDRDETSERADGR